jgi:hypothetical protein
LDGSAVFVLPVSGVLAVRVETLNAIVPVGKVDVDRHPTGYLTHRVVGMNR